MKLGKLAFFFVAIAANARTEGAYARNSDGSPTPAESRAAFQCASDLHSIAVDGLSGDASALLRPRARESFFVWDVERSRAYFPFRSLERVIELFAFDHQGTAQATIPREATADLLAGRRRHVLMHLPWQCAELDRSTCLDFSQLASSGRVAIAPRRSCDGALEVAGFPADEPPHVWAAPRLAYLHLPYDEQLVSIGTSFFRPNSLVDGRTPSLSRPPAEGRVHLDRLRRFLGKLEECASAESGINDVSIQDAYAAAASRVRSALSTRVSR